MKISQILKLVGPALGVISVLTIISKHPWIVTLALLGSVIYFAGVYYAKKGK